MDPITIALLANAAMKVIGPFLSQFATKAAEGLVDKSADAAATGAVTGARKLLRLIKNKFAPDKDATDSLARLEANPEDAVAHAEVNKHLETAIAQDPGFASAVQSELSQVANTNADLAFVNNIQGDVAKLVQIGNVEGNVII